ncbi:hypothetical protein [Caldimonas caldifontis]|uniref:hypothetical protein n=1 Tax=Caldimonas caldifontis TaxID=1452508 RepID=UPI0011B03EDA|nr:hypothetical protein [Caldimonas caldifontis]
MANNKKLTIRTAAKPALVISRPAFSAERLVYVAVANKPLKYPHGRSCIAYIGTTKSGASRIAASAAARAKDLLALHGVTSLSFHIVTCASRQRVKSWHKLETGLILSFRHMYGTVPRCNIKGKNQKWKDELEYFTRSRLEAVLKKYEG